MANTLKICNTVMLIATIVVNALANTIPIGGNTTGDVSKNYPSLFTPSPLTFSIWGIIYILMAVFVLFQWRMFGNQFISNDIIYAIGPWFIISCIMNIAWIFSWHNAKIGLSVIFIVGLLISLIYLVTALKTYKPASVLENISCFGFDIYIGWITAATIANIGVFLVKIDWSRLGMSEQFWTILILIIGAMIGLAYTILSNRYFSTLTLMWAYIGIITKHVSQSGYNKMYPLIILTASISVAVMLIAILANLFFMKRQVA